MIQSWGNKEAREIFVTARSRSLPATLWHVADRKLRLVDRAANLDDLRVPPGNHLEALKGDRAGFHSIRINRQYRIVFRWENGNAHQVAIVDYH